MNEIRFDAIGREFLKQAGELLEQSRLKIHHCLSQLEDPQLWWRPAPELNSIGNLILHVCGNLRQWGIVPLSHEEDQRDRDAEFAAEHHETKPQLISLLESTIEQARELWNAQPVENLLQVTTVQGFEVTVMKAILHTSNHFSGHSHQIILLTRLQLTSRYQFQWTPDSERGDLPI